VSDDASLGPSQPEDTIYVVIPDGPLAVLRPFYKERIKEANSTIASLARESAEGNPISFDDARRLELMPSGMMVFRTQSKIVIKPSRKSPVHVTVAVYNQSIDLHITDENKKKLGEQWWDTLGSINPGSAVGRVSAARAAANKFANEHTVIVRVLDPSAVGFVMSPRPSETAPVRLPFVRSGRRAVPSLIDFAKRMRFELADSFPFSRFPSYRGRYFHAAEDGMFFSEQGRITFLLTPSQQPEGILILSDTDYVALCEVFMGTLFGRNPDGSERLFFPGF
jgi:hypothetical protein